MGATVTAELLISVDGWSGSDGLPGYFGYFGPELEAWMEEEAHQPHVALMGRTTYQVLAELPEEAKDDGYHRMVRQETVVFSQTLRSVDWPRARVSDDLLEEVRRLKEASGPPLRTVGSRSLIRQLLDEKLVDTLRLVTFPLLAGPAGREWAFEGVDSTDFELQNHRVLDDRVLITEYRPTGNDIPRT